MPLPTAWSPPLPAVSPEAPEVPTQREALQPAPTLPQAPPVSSPSASAHTHAHAHAEVQATQPDVQSKQPDAQATQLGRSDTLEVPEAVEMEDAETQTGRWTPFIESIKREAEHAAIMSMEERLDQEPLLQILKPSWSLEYTTFCNLACLNA